MKKRILEFWVIEWVAAIVATAYLVLRLRGFLAGSVTMMHDSYYAEMPLFHFFTENILHGQFAGWNPFSHGGEPFYPLIAIGRMLDPLALLTIGIGHFWTDDTLVLLNWWHFLQTLIACWGAYWLLRRFARHAWTRLALIPLLLFSSFCLGGYRQPALLMLVVWIPFITHFLLRIVYDGEDTPRNWWFLSLFFGLGSESYFFVGPWTFLLFFLIAMGVFYRERFMKVLRSPKLTKHIGLFLIIQALFLAPSAVLLFEQNQFVMPARMQPTPTEEGKPLGGSME